MTHPKQPEALRLAEQYRARGGIDMSHFEHIEWASQAEYVLTSQHARIAELEAENRALKEREEAIGAGGVTGLRNKTTATYPPLPERPEPDGYLTIRIFGKDVEVNAYRDSTVADYVMACIDADREHRAAIAQEGGN